MAATADAAAPERGLGPSPLLELSDLRVTFRTRLGTVYAVQGVNLTVEPGRTLARAPSSSARSRTACWKNR